MTATAILHTLDAAKPFSRLRRALPAVLLPILGLGMLACLDALQTEYRLPEHTLFMTAGTSAEISGTLHGQHSKLPPRIQLSLSPDSTTVTLSRVTVANKIFTSDTVWHTELTLGDIPTPTTFTASVSFPDLPHEAPQSWQINTYSNIDALRRASPSFLFSRFAFEPLPAAFICLLAAVLLGLLYPVLYLADRRALAQNGCLRVFHARPDGPDTLLYCVQPQRNPPKKSMSYQVLSATGQLLGLADLTECGRKHCVFRLHAAQARAGCIVAVC